MIDQNEVVALENGCIGAHIVRHMCFQDQHRGVDMIVECCNTTMCNMNLDGYLRKIRDQLDTSNSDPRRPENSNVLMIIIGAAGTLIIVCIVFGIYKTFRSRMFKKLMGYEKETFLPLSEKEPHPHQYLIDDISLSNTSGAGRTQFVQVS